MTRGRGSGAGRPWEYGRVRRTAWWWFAPVLVLVAGLVGCGHEADSNGTARGSDRCQPLAVVAGEHASDRYDLFRVHSNGHLTRLTRDLGTYDPSVAPDGTWLAATRSEPDEWSDAGGYEGGRIVVLGPDGTVERTIEPRTGWMDHSPSIDPTGHRIAFLRQSKLSAGAEVVLVDRDGGNPRVVAEGGFLGRPAWSPDGTTLAVVRYRLDAPQLLDLLDLVGGATTSWPVGGEGDPVFSPDGTRVLMSSRNYESGQPVVEVDVADGRQTVVPQPKMANWTNATYADRAGTELRVLRFEQVVEMVPQRLQVVGRDGTVRSSTALDVVPIIEGGPGGPSLPGTRTLLTGLSTNTCFTQT